MRQHDGQYRPAVSRAEKARLHRERVARLDRLRRERRQHLVQTGQRPDRYAAMQQYEEEQLRTEEATRTRVTVEEVLMLLNECQYHRKALARLNAKLQDWRDGSPDLDKEYRAFEQAGGVTEFDFADFMDGTFRYRRTRQKRHLRLVSNNRYRVRQKLPDPRDDAA